MLIRSILALTLLFLAPLDSHWAEKRHGASVWEVLFNPRSLNKSDGITPLNCFKCSFRSHLNSQAASRITTHRPRSSTPPFAFLLLPGTQDPTDYVAGCCRHHCLSITPSPPVRPSVRTRSVYGLPGGAGYSPTNRFILRE